MDKEDGGGCQYSLASANDYSHRLWDPGGAGIADKWKNRIHEITGLVATVLPHPECQTVKVSGMVRAALLAAADGAYGEEEALRWANGFRFPQDVCVRDMSLLHSLDGNLSSLARYSHELMKGSRLSQERVHRWVPRSDPDFDRLLRLCEGVRILVPEDFVPNGTPPPLRNKYMRMAPAVNKMFYEAHQEGLVYLLPTDYVLRLDGIHWSSAHWTTKVGKQKGRNLGDLSNDERGGALNSEAVKVLGQASWGDVRHPTVDCLVAMILRQLKRSSGDWSRLVLWKMDLKGAFTLMFIHPESVRLLAMQLTDGVAMMYHTGLFGSTLMPGAFDVITRVLRRRINDAVHGEVEMYVDDVMGVCLLEEREHDIESCTVICEGLLGEQSVAHDKTCDSRSTGKIDWLGWEVNVISGIIGISRKNFLRALYGFFDVDTEARVQVKRLQRLASWASRYSLVCRPMRPLTSALFAEGQGMRNLEISRVPSQEVVRSIYVWRLFLVAMEVVGDGYRRSLESFEFEPPSFWIEYDSSLTGFGFRISRLVEGEMALWKVASINSNFDLEGSSCYQNTMEYISIVLAFGFLVQNGIRSRTVCVLGDNVSSLKWAATERFKGNLCVNAATCLIALLSASSMDVVDTVHVRGEDNTTCDQLSRGKRPQDLGYKSEEIFEGLDRFTCALLHMCNPLQSYTKPAEFCSFFNSVHQLVTSMMT